MTNKKHKQPDITFTRLMHSGRKTTKGRKKKNHVTITGLFWDHAKNCDRRYNYNACVNALMDRWQQNLPISGLAKGESILYAKHKELNHPIVETRKQKRRRIAAFVKG